MINQKPDAKTTESDFFRKNPALKNIFYSIGYYFTLKFLAQAA